MASRSPSPPTPLPDARSRADLLAEIADLEARVARLESDRSRARQVLLGDPQREVAPLLAQIPALVWVTDSDLRLTWWTGGGIRSLGLTAEDLIGVDIYTYLGTRDPEEDAIAAHQGALEGRSAGYEQQLDGVHMQVHVEPHRDEDGAIIGVIGVGLDITARVHADQDRIHLVGELREALERVRTLSGMIPICMHCKNVRNDGGFWEQVEHYVREHSHAEFTHSICPDCMDDALAEMNAHESATPKRVGLDTRKDTA